MRPSNGLIARVRDKAKQRKKPLTIILTTLLIALIGVLGLKINLENNLSFRATNAIGERAFSWIDEEYGPVYEDYQFLRMTTYDNTILTKVDDRTFNFTTSYEVMLHAKENSSAVWMDSILLM